MKKFGLTENDGYDADSRQAESCQEAERREHDEAVWEGTGYAEDDGRDIGNQQNGLTAVPEHIEHGIIHSEY